MSDDLPGPTAQLARKLLIDLAIMTVIGVVLAIIGPFGSSGAPLGVRLLSWLSLAYVGYAVYSPMGWIVERLHTSLNLPTTGLWVAAVMLATIPLAAIIWTIGFLPDAPPWPTPQQALETYINVLVIGASITVLFHLIERGKPDPSAAAATASAMPVVELDTKPGFLDRLPPALGSELIALEMEDHYVRAHTALGSELVLMRLRDAMAELDGIEGMQVHRSWWVARHAVGGVKREGRNVRLLLDTGIEAPVSRPNVAVLKDAGWI
uniref:LytTR family DNA-binding domain-containing protein n=1 Tax=Parerythrobacter lutipelagi TaxID=1964208 RepID=UPI0010F7432F|nr:LytTR family DNA-binding domain-containing protein [Parerythrobacter lutipelagi]